MTIDVGPACTERPDGDPSGNTNIMGENPANAAGTIDSVCIWAGGGAMTGIEYAAFTAEGSDVFSTNGDTSGSNLSCAENAQTTHTAAGNDFTAFAIATGEYIGIYFGAGYLRQLSGTGFSFWQVSGDNVPCSSVTFTDWEDYSDALYGTGTETPAGRTTRNTDAFPLGVNVGTSFRF